MQVGIILQSKTYLLNQFILRSRHFVGIVVFISLIHYHQPFHVHIHATQLSEVRFQVIQDKIANASGSKSNIK